MQDHRDIACAIVETLRPLLDTDNCIAMSSTWMIMDDDIDGKNVWDRLRELTDQYEHRRHHGPYKR
jgi:hypothetical protein